MLFRIVLCFGITPAYAGKSPPTERPAINPRGSPPRMRGKETGAAGQCDGDGITPAYAGKSKMGVVSPGARQDHPRVCGEKMIVWSVCLASVGSPPRMRGKDSRSSELELSSGITPAYAGKRCNSKATAPLQRDHPRMCGEKAEATLPQLSTAGSPPHVRGKARADSAIGNDAGITPACAGKSGECVG